MKKTTSKTERFLNLVRTRDITAASAAKKLDASIDTVYNIAYNLRAQGHDVSVVNGKYTYYGN